MAVIRKLIVLQLGEDWLSFMTDNTQQQSTVVLSTYFWEPLMHQSLICTPPSLVPLQGVCVHVWQRLGKPMVMDKPILILNGLCFRTENIIWGSGSFELGRYLQSRPSLRVPLKKGLKGFVDQQNLNKVSFS